MTNTNRFSFIIIIFFDVFSKVKPLATTAAAPPQITSSPPMNRSQVLATRDQATSPADFGTFMKYAFFDLTMNVLTIIPNLRRGSGCRAKPFQLAM